MKNDIICQFVVVHRFLIVIVILASCKSHQFQKIKFCADKVGVFFSALPIIQVYIVSISNFKGIYGEIRCDISSI